MYCKKCGNYLDDNARFCNLCGERADTSADDRGGYADSYRPQPDPNPQPYGETTYGVGSGSAYGGPYQPYGGTQGIYGPAPGVLPMSWFKFVIYFQLFATAAVSFYNAFLLISGMTYSLDGGIGPGFVYSMFSGLKLCDLLFGGLFAALGAFCFVARSNLAGFKTKGPTMYLAVYIISLALSLLYPLSTSLITGLPLSDIFDVSYISSSAGSLVMILCNVTYFSKRRHLFVN